MITKGQKLLSYTEIRNAYAQQKTDQEQKAYLRSQMDRATQTAWRCVEVFAGSEWHNLHDEARDRMFDRVRGIVTL
jgi:hypothetical protein